MEKWEVIGFRYCDFTDKAGVNVKGYKLFLMRQENPNIQGMECMPIFVKLDAMNGYVPCLDDIIVLYYNKYGKVSSVNHI